MFPYQREWEDSCKRVRVRLKYVFGLLFFLYNIIHSSSPYPPRLLKASLGHLHQAKRRRGSFRLWRIWAFLVERSDNTGSQMCQSLLRWKKTVRKWLSHLPFTERWDWTSRFYLWHFLRAHTEDLPSHRYRGALQENVSVSSRLLFLIVLYLKNNKISSEYTFNSITLTQQRILPALPCAWAEQWYHLFKYSPSESCCIMLEIIRTNVSVPAALTMSGQPNLLPPFNINYVQPNDNSQRRVMINKILLKA